jgi:Golgi nucleoside diphosphatase
VEDDENDVECVRRGSSRANIPLSAFGRLPSEQDVPLNANEVAEHLLPLFEYAASVIPSQFYESTSVKYQATAGMRLLQEEEQELVYDALYQGLIESKAFVFESMQRQDIQTLSGELEGFYGAVAANYLQGVVDTRLRIIQSENEHSGPVGALDMGGSSTQIVFLPDAEQSVDIPQECPNDPQDETCQAASQRSSPSRLNGDHFFSTSYLSYGVDQFRERLWSTLVAERKQEEEDDPESCVSTFIQNPCANKGYQTEWEGFTLVGTGDTEECIRQTQRLIPHSEVPHDNHADIENKVGGVEHPAVRGKFLAMSLYYFSLDSLRVFSEPDDEAHAALNLSWPNPSIEELHNALDGLCSRDWDGDMELQHDTHTFTRAEVLPHRCVETVYMVTLLKDGFGFHPSSRDITFTFLVDGSEVEWTLGMALAMNAEETALENAKEQQSPKINATYEEDCEEDKPLMIQTSTAHPLFLAESIGQL